MHSLKILGIDLAGSLKRPSGVAIFHDNEVKLFTLFSNEDIMKLVKEVKPLVVAIDAPLSFPKNGAMRNLDKLMVKLHFKVLPPGFPGMRQLTERGIFLKKNLLKLNIRVIEIHPNSSIKALGFASRDDFYKNLLRLFRICGEINKHTIDALAAAYTGLAYVKGKYFVIHANDGSIILPYSDSILTYLSHLVNRYHMRKSPAVAVDVVILVNGGLVLVKRLNDPFKDYWALPGGFVEYGERVEEAARREAKEETGLEIDILGLVGVYSDPKRDPRGHVISIAFLAKGKGVPKASSDAKEVKIFREIPTKLAFDHKDIIRDALELAKKLNIKNLPRFKGTNC